MCGHVAFARGKKDGSRSEAAAIARVYKKRRRSKTPGASSKGSVMSPTASLVTKSELGSEEDEASAFASEPAATTPLPSPSPTPSLYPGAAAASEAVREGQSRLFAQQLRAMHCMVRELGRLPEFRSAF